MIILQLLPLRTACQLFFFKQVWFAANWHMLSLKQLHGNIIIRKKQHPSPLRLLPACCVSVSESVCVCMCVCMCTGRGLVINHCLRADIRQPVNVN